MSKIIFSSNKNRMYQCCRCAELKDWYRFRDGQVYWNYYCIRCENSPVGKMPIPQTEEHCVPH